MKEEGTDLADHLFKFKKVLPEKRCACCKNTGDKGYVSTEYVTFKLWRVIFILCFICGPLFILGCFLAYSYNNELTKNGYDILWCPECGGFFLSPSKHERNFLGQNTEQTLMSVCMKDLNKTTWSESVKNKLINSVNKFSKKSGISW
jgi:hypothetical protein